jgi:hypothetical protein
MSLWSWFRPQPAVDTLRDWLSEDEWQAAVAEARKRPMDFNGRERRDRGARRYQTIRRCLLRVERRGQVLGMLLVRTRNISATGACVIHGGRVPRHATATVVVQTGDGEGVITTGRVAWCKRLRGAGERAHEIGIAFDAPIDASCFADPAAEAA